MSIHELRSKVEGALAVAGMSGEMVDSQNRKYHDISFLYNQLLMALSSSFELVLLGLLFRSLSVFTLLKHAEVISTTSHPCPSSFPYSYHLWLPQPEQQAYWPQTQHPSLQQQHLPA